MKERETQRKHDLYDDLSKKKLPFTFTMAPAPILGESNERLSTVRSSLIPSVFARIFMPLSFVETASNIPSLLNRTQGEA